MTKILIVVVTVLAGCSSAPSSQSVIVTDSGSDAHAVEKGDAASQSEEDAARSTNDASSYSADAASSPDGASSSTGDGATAPTCLPPGAVCTSSPNSCCPGELCRSDLSDPSQASLCASICTTGTDCASGCCATLSNATTMACSPIGFCPNTCAAIGASCTENTDCCLAAGGVPPLCVGENGGPTREWFHS